MTANKFPVDQEEAAGATGAHFPQLNPSFVKPP